MVQVDVQAMVEIDSSRAEVLHQVLSVLADRGVTVAISRANPELLALLKRYHLFELIGDEHIYPTNRHVVAAYRNEYDLPNKDNRL